MKPLVVVIALTLATAAPARADAGEIAVRAAVYGAVGAIGIGGGAALGLLAAYGMCEASACVTAPSAPDSIEPVVLVGGTLMGALGGLGSALVVAGAVDAAFLE